MKWTDSTSENYESSELGCLFIQIWERIFLIQEKQNEERLNLFENQCVTNKMSVGTWFGLYIARPFLINP